MRHKLDLDHLGDLPEPLSDLESRVDEYLSSGENREVIITSHLRLAAFYAMLFTEKCPRKEQDFVDVAFLTLVESVDKFRLVARDSNITPYLASHIRYALLSELVEGHATRLATKRSWLDNLHDAEVPETAKCLNKPNQVPDKQRISLEFRDILDVCARTETERDIFLMTYQGYTLGEISEALGPSVPVLSRVRDKLFQRFIHYWTKDDE